MLASGFGCACAVPERGQQRVAVRVQLELARGRARELSGQADLFDVPDARVAQLQMDPHALGLLWRQRTVEIGRDELDHFLAADPAGLHAAPKYCSTSLRTFERARCRSTRWLPSLSS